MKGINTHIEYIQYSFLTNEPERVQVSPVILYTFSGDYYRKKK